MICVSVACMTDLAGAIGSGAALIELRLDLIKEAPKQIYPLIPKEMKTILCCRPGVFGEKVRLDMLMEGMKLGATYADIEIETAAGEMEVLRNAAMKSGTSVIVSYHNFERTPDREDLESVMIACYEKGGDVAKIATQVIAPEDVRNLLSLYDFPGKKVILGMGSLGRITRVMGPYLGAEFTFASMGQGAETAPGQLSITQLIELYKVIDES